MSAVWPTHEPFQPERRGFAELAGRAEWWACFVILALMSQALLAPLFAPDQMPDNVPWLRTVWLPVYGAVAVMLAANPLRATRVAVPAMMSLALVGWAFASSRWSIEPDITFRRSVALLFTSLFGLHLAARYSWRELAELAAGMFLLLAVGSYIACIVFPGFGVTVEIHPGAWKGLWYEKNQLGGIMVYGVLACACAAILAPGRRRLWIGAAAACLGLVAMSQSTTALLGSAIVLGGLAGLALLRRGGAWAVATVWALAAAVGGFLALILVAPDLFFHLIGKDPTLTGRTEIWAALLHRVEVRPWRGYGYGAFWMDPWGPAWFVRQEVDWSAPNAHDGWLDILVQLGVVGLALAALHFLTTAVAAVARIGRGAEAYWAILFMVLFALFSISESTVMQYNNLTWAMYVAIGAKLLAWRGFTAEPAPRRRAVKLFPDEE